MQFLLTQEEYNELKEKAAGDHSKEISRGIKEFYHDFGEEFIKRLGYIKSGNYGIDMFWTGELREAWRKTREKVSGEYFIE